MNDLVDMLAMARGYHLRAGIIMSVAHGSGGAGRVLCTGCPAQVKEGVT